MCSFCLFGLSSEPLHKNWEGPSHNPLPTTPFKCIFPTEPHSLGSSTRTDDVELKAEARARNGAQQSNIYLSAHISPGFDFQNDKKKLIKYSKLWLCIYKEVT